MVPHLWQTSRLSPLYIHCFHLLCRDQSQFPDCNFIWDRSKLFLILFWQDDKINASSSLRIHGKVGTRGTAKLMPSVSQVSGHDLLWFDCFFQSMSYHNIYSCSFESQPALVLLTSYKIGVKTGCSGCKDWQGQVVIFQWLSLCPARWQPNSIPLQRKQWLKHSSKTLTCLTHHRYELG